MKVDREDIPSQVRHSAQWVMAQARKVSINQEGVALWADSLGRQAVSHWMSAAPVCFDRLTLQDHLRLALAFNAISFSYWGEPRWAIFHEGRSYDGSWGMLVALLRALEGEDAAFSPEWLANLRQADLHRILRGQGEIPLFAERYGILRELGCLSLDRGLGDLSEFLHANRNDASTVLQNVIEIFPSFRDKVQFEDREVSFYKRAQLLVSDWNAVLLRHTGQGLQGWDLLTACADYKVPQMLRQLGAIIYSSELAAKVDGGVEIPMGSEFEVEIRAATICAVDSASALLRARGRNLAPMELNDCLWLAAQDKANLENPYHKTRTLSY